MSFRFIVFLSIYGMYVERKTIKLKLAEIVLTRPQNSTDTKVTHRIRVEVSRFYSISFSFAVDLKIYVVYHWAILELADQSGYNLIRKHSE